MARESFFQCFDYKIALKLGDSDLSDPVKATVSPASEAAIPNPVRGIVVSAGAQEHTSVEVSFSVPWRVESSPKEWASLYTVQVRDTVTGTVKRERTLYPTFGLDKAKVSWRVEVTGLTSNTTYDVAVATTTCTGRGAEAAALRYTTAAVGKTEGTFVSGGEGAASL